MTERTVIAARAALTMKRPPGVHGRVLVEWAAEPNARFAGQQPRIGRQMVSDLLIAHAGRGATSWLQIADVIICPGQADTRGSPGCLWEAFRRYPACAVAVVELGAGGCLAGTPGQAPIRLTVGHRGAAAGSCALACAAFVHGWLATGQSLASLRPARLRVFSSAPGDQECPAPGAIMSLRFGVVYAPEAPDPDAPSRSRTSSASGAPICT